MSATVTTFPVEPDLGDDEHALHLGERLDVVLVHRVRKHLLDVTDPFNEILELVRLHRQCGIGPVEVL